MKKFVLIITLILALSLFVVPRAMADTNDDYKQVIKTTKLLKKLSDKNNLDEIAKYFSENYKSFDGSNKKEILEIHDVAYKMYPNSKTKETIKKIETKGDLIKVYIEDVSTNNLDVKGEDAKYAVQKKVKGKMVTNADYAMFFKKEEDGVWRVIGDEIYKETTDIRYGEAIDIDFEMENPKVVKGGAEFTVKTKIIAPDGRFVIGSIGHDKIIYPPEKYLDPYRTIDETGILERVMIANNERKNEYVNSTFALVVNQSIKKEKKIYNRAAISGMGIYIKRVNLEENVPVL